MTHILWIQLTIAFPVIIPNECFEFIKAPDHLEGPQYHIYFISPEEQNPSPLPAEGRKYYNSHILRDLPLRNKKRPSRTLKSNQELTLENVILTHENRLNPTRKPVLQLLAKYPNIASNYLKILDSGKKEYDSNKLQQILKVIEDSGDSRLARVEKYLSENRVATKLFGNDKPIARCRTLRRQEASKNTVCVTYPASWGPGANYTVPDNPPYYYYPVFYYPYYYPYYWG